MVINIWIKRKKNKPSQRKQNGGHEGRPQPLFPKKSFQNRAPPHLMVPLKYRIVPTPPPRRLGPSLGTGTPLPNPRLCAPPSRAESGRNVGISKRMRRRRSYSNRQIPHQGTWTGRRRQMMRGPPPQRFLTVVQIHPSRRSLTLRLRRNHPLQALSLLREFQGVL